MNHTDTELLDFVEKNEAWLTHASSEPEERRWRCQVEAQHFASPDSRERLERIGYGSNARDAIRAAMWTPKVRLSVQV